MPDTDRNDSRADWSSAFAALPMEAPPSGGWQRMERALDAAPARRQRRHWPVWLAAAAIGAIALVPVLHRSADEATAPASNELAARKRTPVDTSRPPLPASKRPETRVANTTEPAPSSEATRIDDAPAATRADETPRIASAMPTETAPDPRAAELRNQVATLQAESAQLEALLAIARDDRVASASGAALAVEFDRRIGRIDASLSQPGLDDVDRAALWQARVSTMRELAGIETTQRWLLSSGERYDGALVSVD
ncbi:hypothetical protein [Lysobacter auxotrophicus]|uniref:Uncharacterized protein n=1 Tax=Lysobacter auxotrophicus TaxID=2992573 RepID=A0ABN6UPD2_9GAMM|nr:hypothetical protein [Lysobacter auxotrophicus]BDU17775.1 hypothetical protein LA521A_29760 [Lysobacter auxotrophicus]